MEEPLVEGGVIRRLWTAEAHLYRDHLLRLDSDSRRNRFGGAISDAVISHHVEHMDGLGVVLHGFFFDGALRGVAEIRLLGAPFADSAEAAFSIEKPWQSNGVGSALLERCLLTARNRGIKHLHLLCLSDNQRMQQLARKFEAELSFDFGTVIGDVETAYPTPLSMFRELVSEGNSLARVMFDAQARLLR